MADQTRITILIASPVLTFLLAVGSVWSAPGRLPLAPGTEVPESEGHPRPPAAPGMLLAAPGNARALLTWTPPETDGGSPLLGYVVYAGTNPLFLAPRAVLSNTLFYTDLHLTNGVAYHYRVAAYNAMNVSAPSKIASAAPGDFDTSLNAFPRFGVAPLRVEFVLSAWDPALSDLGTSLWDFADGGHATVRGDDSLRRRVHSVLHTYEDPGVYVVTTLYGGGRADPGPRIPVVVLPPLVVEAVASPTAGRVPLDVSFRTTASGGLLSYFLRWDFGDGTQNETDAPVHTYEEAGFYTATLSVRDAAGNEAVRTVRIRAEPLAEGFVISGETLWVVAISVAVSALSVASGFVLGRRYESRRRRLKP